MRTTFLSAAVLLFFAFALPLATSEICPSENCMSPDKCEELVRGRGVVCSQRGKSCCSVVKSEFRTHCRHHGGVCMDKCADTLKRDTVDCNGGSICCVLV